MNAPYLQLVLLLAVATSQVFGGLSCCCVTREISAILTYRGPTGTLNGQERSAASKSEAPKCPKCVASKAANGFKTKKKKSDGSCSLGDDNHCRCVKVVSTAAVQTESFWLSIAPPALVVSLVLWNAIPAVEADETRRYEKPIRFGGRSWQSLACIWKN